MRYWLYENWQAQGHGVRVRAASCSFCNDGRGVHKTDNETNGRWLGLFSTRKEAHGKAQQLPGVTNVRDCLRRVGQ